MGEEQTFVIVGASQAGAVAARSLREQGFAGRVVLIGAEAQPPYERPPLSKGYLTGSADRGSTLISEDGWYDKFEVELRLGVRATGLDPAAHVVQLGGGSTLGDSIRYDKLLLATGSRPRRLAAPGSDFDGVCYLRTLTDADALADRLRPGAQVVIVGAGWIGLEVAAAARARGAEVTVLELDTLPLRRILGDELGAVYADLHSCHGVRLVPSASVAEFGGLAGRLTHVVLLEETEIPADVAVIGIGARPRVELAEAAGLTVAGGIRTDERLRTSAADVFACGDVASSWHPMIGTWVRSQHWANAVDGATAAAASMLGKDVSYNPVPYFYSDQYGDATAGDATTSDATTSDATTSVAPYEAAPGISMEYAGYVTPGGYDQLVLRGDATVRPGENPSFIAFWTKDGRVLAGMNVNIWGVQEEIRALVRAGYRGVRVGLPQLANPQIPMASLLAG